jgi:hypothetical protein
MVPKRSDIGPATGSRVCFDQKEDDFQSGPEGQAGERWLAAILVAGIADYNS